ncbi:excinuclease ABC subunit C [bacterium (Candidatus Howlettbacteria) CG_4_10_14_0_8_um_filter_40_9]|nr:MAG: excinuclease ABC subunit C [bacterium (Candidatus Howlettbacteria) CG_4_10_14_0_8_um_filter_40_9]
MNYYTYIMANDRPTLYTSMTNNLIRRVYEHKKELVEGFTKKYHLHKLVYYEVFDSPKEAIIREKQIKDLDRNEKINLIKKFNINFEDLYNKII